MNLRCIFTYLLACAVCTTSAKTCIVVEYGTIGKHHADMLVLPITAGSAPKARAFDDTVTFDLAQYPRQLLLRIDEPGTDPALHNSLYAAYYSTLLEGHQTGYRTIAFAITDQCKDNEYASTIKHSVIDFIAQYPEAYQTITFFASSQQEYSTYTTVFKKHLRRSYTQRLRSCIKYSTALVGAIAIISFFARTPLKRPSILGLRSSTPLNAADEQTKELIEHACIFVPSLGAGKMEALVYATRSSRSGCFVPADVIGFDCPDTSNGNNFSYLRHAALGQEADIATLKTVTDTVDRDNIVLFGVCKGASTAITYQATHNDPRIKALILESPFDSIEGVIHEKLRQYGLWWIPGLHTVAHRITALFFGNYSTTGIRPIDALATIHNKELPILIICSAKDTLIPWTSSHRLYTAFIKHGFTNVHILITEHGRHCNTIHDDANRTVCRNTARAFFKRYGIRWKWFRNSFGCLQDGRCQEEIALFGRENGPGLINGFNFGTMQTVATNTPLPEHPPDTAGLEKRLHQDGEPYYVCTPDDIWL